MKIRRIALPLALAASIGIVSSGCMGSFALTKMLYNFNNTITGNKIVNNLIFWVLLWLPVYGGAMFIDGVILNLIEFWTGGNPLAAQLQESDTRLANFKATQAADGSITVQRGDQTFTVEPMAGHRVRISSQDGLLGFAEFNADGSSTVYDATGRPLRTISAADFEAAQPALQQLVMAQ
ncbi:MAG: DUF3332 family protein [Deltaproteobacteria bacterium]|nr:DUF3332 family protein [Deltaproteobacteria bacterium]